MGTDIEKVNLIHCTGNKEALNLAARGRRFTSCLNIEEAPVFTDWVILVGGERSGTRLFFGSERQAEERRAMTANRLHCLVKKRYAEQKESDSGKISLCLNHQGFKNTSPYVCGCGECNVI